MQNDEKEIEIPDWLNKILNELSKPKREEAIKNIKNGLQNYGFYDPKKDIFYLIGPQKKG